MRGLEPHPAANAQPTTTRPPAQQPATTTAAIPPVSAERVGSALAAAAAPGDWSKQSQATAKLGWVLAANADTAATAMGTDGSDSRTVAQAQAVLAQHVAAALGITPEQAAQYVASAAQALQAGG